MYIIIFILYSTEHYIFDSLPLRKQASYQLCDVPQIQSVLESASFNRTCDVKNGWLSNSTLKEIREIMKKKLIEWITSSKQQPSDESDGSKSSDEEDDDFPLDQAAEIFDL